MFLLLVKSTEYSTSEIESDRTAFECERESKDLISGLKEHLSQSTFAAHILTIKRELRFNFHPVNQWNVLKDYEVGRGARIPESFTGGLRRS